jgi:hypothetical protein
MYTPHTVTLYNVFHTVDESTFEESTETHITILEGVFLDQSKGVNVRESGLEGADAATLYIPFTVRATDGLTGNEKRFAEPMEFVKAADKTGLWTLEPGRNTFFIKGIVVAPGETEMHTQLSHDGVYTVTKVDAKDYGSPSMQHWEVGGK